MDSNLKTVVRFPRLKRLVGSIICCNLFGRFIGFVYRDRIPFNGGRIDVNGVRVPPKNKALLFWGLYESSEYRYVRDYLLPDLPTIELGSSIGAISSQIAKRLRTNTLLICVEGNPRVQSVLQRNLAANASHLSTQVVNAVVAYGRKQIAFGLSDDNLSSYIDREQSDVVEVQIPTVQLAELVKSLPEPRYQLVADIEGAEAAILVHDAESLLNCQRVIIELHATQFEGNTFSVDDLCSKFHAIGFRTLAQYGPVAVFEKNK